MTTAADITRAMRELHPRPVRLSARADTGPGSAGRFLLRVPSACATSEPWMQDYLSRHLGVKVTVVAHRDIRRRDCGRDVEYILRVA